MRNVLLIGLIAVIGFSAYQYDTSGQIGWADQLGPRLRAVTIALRSRWSEYQAEFAPSAEPSSGLEEGASADAWVDDQRPETLLSRLFGSDSDRFELVGRVVDVMDGDSFELRVKGMTLPIRLFGIDTPEYNQAHGDEATRALRNKILRETVFVTVEDIDAYDRFVGTVQLQNENINVSMVAEGHAWWYQRYAGDAGKLRKAQRSAREAGVGLWAGADPIPPWDWRRSR